MANFQFIWTAAAVLVLLQLVQASPVLVQDKKVETKKEENVKLLTQAEWSIGSAVICLVIVAALTYLGVKCRKMKKRNKVGVCASLKRIDGNDARIQMDLVQTEVEVLMEKLAHLEQAVAIREQFFVRWTEGDVTDGSVSLPPSLVASSGDPRSEPPWSPPSRSPTEMLPGRQLQARLDI